MGLKKKKTVKSLSASRPPTFNQKPKSITRKATKALISAHHTLEKRLLQASRSGDEATKAKIKAEMAALGGLARYQQASLQGQRTDRGGDSSRVLLDWFKQTYPCIPANGRLDMLEVGALSTDNACSKSGYFNIQRIDLNSQSEGILQQDFMKRPLPRDDSECFDLISLSLVLNFVPDPKGRGDMLLRTLDFLREPKGEGDSEGLMSPGIFLVLPLPCVSNSRYMDEKRLEMIMGSLGFTLCRSKTTQRIIYQLWKRVSDRPSKLKVSKSELRSGPTRNNFALVLDTHG